MKKTIALCIGIGLMFSQLAQAQKDAAQASKLAHDGAQAAKDQDYNKAIDLLRKAAEMDRKYAPNLSAAYQQRAFSFTNEQRFEDAINDLNEAIKINPRDAHPYEARAAIDMKINNYDKAIADYGEAMKINPDDVKNYLYRGYIYELRGDINNSMADTEKALKIQPKNPEAMARRDRLKKIQQAQTANAPQTGGTPVAAPAQNPPPPPPKKP